MAERYCEHGVSMLQASHCTECGRARIRNAHQEAALAAWLARSKAIDAREAMTPEADRLRRVERTLRVLVDLFGLDPREPSSFTMPSNERAILREFLEGLER